jgi:hypothetical protein
VMFDGPQAVVSEFVREYRLFDAIQERLAF